MNKIQLLKLTGIATFTLLIAGVMFYVQNKLNTVTTTNTTLIEQSIIPSSLDDFCHCNLIISDAAQVQLLDTTTGERTTTVVVGSEGMSENPQLGYVATSPTGQQTLLNDYKNHQLIIVDSVTGKRLRALPFADDQFIAAWTWSPDESVMLIILNRQLSSGFPPTITNQAIIWTATKQQTITIQTTATIDNSYNLLSINNDATDAILGWMAEKGVVLYHYRSGKELKQLASSLLQMDGYPRNSSVTLSGIGQGHALLSMGEKILNIDVDNETINVLTDTAWSGFQFSPMSQDGGTILYAQTIPGTAHGQVMRYITSQHTSVEQVTPFDIGTGFLSAIWMPSGRFLFFRDSYHQRWLAVDVSNPEKPLYSITIPPLEENYNIIGFTQTRPMTSQESVLFNLGEPKLTATEKEKLDQQITDWSLYTEDSVVQIGDSNCEKPAAAKQLAELDAAGKRSLMLNDGLKLTITPNIFHWTNAQLQSFGNDVVCGVGTTAPRAIVDDNILWWMGNCIGGITPVKSDAPEYHQMIRCVQAEEVVDQHFSFGD